MTARTNGWKRKLFLLLLIGAAALGGAFIWKQMQPAGLPSGIASGNGRIEATEIDVATRFPGRLAALSVREGDFVEAGQTVAQMDKESLEAQLREAGAQVRQAESAKATALAVVAQRENAKITAGAVVAQRQNDLAFAEKQLKRTGELVRKGFVSAQQLDADLSRKQGAVAALSAARSSVVEAQAAISAARSQVVEAQSRIEAAVAISERIRADMADISLKAPRTGRVQNRLAEPGEILAAGGKVVTLLDLTDVYMTIFLPGSVAGRLAIGSDARIILDAAPEYVIPAKVSFVAAQAQFTPKTVETASEREKLVFKVRVQIDKELLRQYETRVKSGLTGVAYVATVAQASWPEFLRIKLPSATPPPGHAKP